MYHTGMKNKYHFIVEFKDLSEDKQDEIEYFVFTQAEKISKNVNIKDIAKACESSFVEWEVVING